MDVEIALPTDLRSSRMEKVGLEDRAKVSSRCTFARARGWRDAVYDAHDLHVQTGARKFHMQT